jgi:hypothetical protein
MKLSPGTRLRSVVCDTQAMVIAAPATDVALTCGGAPMIALTDEPPEGVGIAPDAKTGTLIGKRYVDESGDLELLCTKPGEGGLAADGRPLGLKEAKALPSSD